MKGHGVRHLDENSNPRVPSPIAPFFQIQLRVLLVRLFTKHAQLLFHPVGLGQRLLESQGLLKAFLLVLLLIQVFGILQKQPTCSFEQFLPKRVRLPLKLD